MMQLQAGVNFSCLKTFALKMNVYIYIFLGGSKFLQTAVFIIYVLRFTDWKSAKYIWFTSWSKDPTANQMALIAFSTCEENDTSNKVLRIMFLDVWAVTVIFIQLAAFHFYKEIFRKCWSLKTWTRKGLLLQSRIMWKVSKTGIRKTCEIAGNVFEKRKERRARSATHRARRIKQAPCGVYSFCETQRRRGLWAFKFKMPCFKYWKKFEGK